MKKISLILILFLFFPTFVKATFTTSSVYGKVKLYFFYEENCTSCQKEKEWLEKYLIGNYQVQIEYIALENNETLYQNLKKAYKIKKDTFPILFVGSTSFQDFTFFTKEEIKKAISSYESASTYCDLVAKVKKDEDLKDCIKQNREIYNPPFPFLKLFPLFLLISCLLSLLFLKKINLKK